MVHEALNPDRRLPEASDGMNRGISSSRLSILDASDGKSVTKEAVAQRNATARAAGDREGSRSGAAGQPA